MLKNFNQLIKQAKSHISPRRRVAVAGANDPHALAAAVQAQEEQLCDTLLVGKVNLIKKALLELSKDPKCFDIVDSGDHNPGTIAVHCVRDGHADFLMKGAVETKDLLKPVLSKENGLSLGGTMSSVVVAELPNRPKMWAITDGGMLINPSLEQKKDALVNAVNTLIRLGIEKPNVAVLCAVEKVSEKMPETLHAKALMGMNQTGEIENCNVVGPISYDLISSKESARIKGYDCPYCGDFDLIVSPCITTGNALTKSWAYEAGALWAGQIIGAKVPIVLVSRGSSAKEKYLSILLASLSCGK